MILFKSYSKYTIFIFIKQASIQFKSYNIYYLNNIISFIFSFKAIKTIVKKTLNLEIILLLLLFNYASNYLIMKTIIHLFYLLITFLLK